MRGHWILLLPLLPLHSCGAYECMIPLLLRLHTCDAWYAAWSVTEEC